MDERRFLPRLTSGGAIAPAGSETPDGGADRPPGDGIQKSAPGRNGYDYRGEIVPTSPVSLPPLQKAPAAQKPTAGGPSANKRPFFIPSSPPPAPSTVQSIPVAATPEPGAATTFPPETVPLVLAPELAPSPSPGQGSEELYWQTLAVENAMLDPSQYDDEEYLYETYFHRV
jgi:hypothetical protein